MSVACAEAPIPGVTNTSVPPANTQPLATETPTPSGITGETLMGPACPGPVQIDTPCPDIPVQATIAVLNANLEEVSRVQSDAQGKFTLPLPPGTYTLQPKPISALQRAEPMTVTVVAGDFVSVIITYDSGIR
jgi:hypothetical protein